MFGDTGESPYLESDPAAPLNVYGESKLAGEEAISASGAPHIILRTSWLYGPDRTNFLRTMLDLAAEQEEIRVVSDQLGAPTPVRFVADATAMILRQAGGYPRRLFRTHGGVVHLAAAGWTSWHGFAQAIIEGASDRGCVLALKRVLPIMTADCPRPARRPADARLSLDLLRERFGVTPTDWRAALESELDDVVAQATVG